MDVASLDEATRRRWWEVRALEPAGPMRAFLGERVSVEELRRSDMSAVAAALDDPDAGPEAVGDELLASIRAYRVPALIGQSFTLASSRELQAEVARLLTGCLPDVAWDVTGLRSGPLHKYLIVHGCLAAPLDHATGQPMALELFADTLAIDGRPVDQAVRLERSRAFLRDADAAIEARLELRIEAATWANLAYAGVGVPFYL
jgi:hypothetical protein